MYPVLLDIAGKLCVVIGGGSVAARKVQGLLESGAIVIVVSPDVTSELAGLASQGIIEWREKTYTRDDLNGATLVFATTDSREVQDLVSREAKANGLLVNVADDPANCSFHVPATLRRGDLTLSVSTSGKSPAVAALIRQQLEDEFGPEYDILLQVMSLVRKHIVLETESLSQADRKKIYKKILHHDIIDWIRTGRDDKLQDHLKNVLGQNAGQDLILPKLDT